MDGYKSPFLFPSLLTRILLAQYIIYTSLLYFSDSLGVPASKVPFVFPLLWGGFSVYIFGHVLLYLTRKKWMLMHVLDVVIPTVYSLLFIYNWRIKTQFSFAIAIDNFNEAFSPESYEVMIGIFHGVDLFHLIAVASFSLLLTIRERKHFDAYHGYPFKKTIVACLVGIYAITVAAAFPNFDQFATLAQSAYLYFMPRTQDTFIYRKLDLKPFPYVRMSGRKSNFDISKAPNVFVIALESFSNTYISRVENGKEVTPVMNSLLKRGVHVEKMYGPSMQTAKGHFVIGCSILPMMKGKGFYRYDKTNFYCLADVLKEHGYQNIFYQSYSNSNFDMTSEFSLENGFHHFFVSEKSRLSKLEQQKNVWGWGVQDNLSYRQLFSRLDELEKGNRDKRPYYAFVASISNHMRFDFLPDDQKYIYPDEKEDRQKFFINSLHLSDRYLDEFFKQLEKRSYLKNSIVIVTADHSFPSGEHGNYFVEKGAYEEAFRIPFVILWPDHLKPQLIDDQAYSQMDIAPTILDLLGIYAKTPFMGNSIFGKNKSEYVYSIQPYDGLFVSIVKYPFKYLFHEKYKDEYLYNLEEDPMEKVNLFDKYRNKELVLNFRNELGRVYLNQKLIKENRIWHSK